MPVHQLHAEQVPHGLAPHQLREEQGKPVVSWNRGQRHIKANPPAYQGCSFVCELWEALVRLESHDWVLGTICKEIKPINTYWNGGGGMGKEVSEWGNFKIRVETEDQDETSN